MTNPLNDILQLPCGAIIPNRICKAAMTEGFADELGNSTPALETLYKRWSLGGAGLLISGNVMVDSRYLEAGGNLVLDGDHSVEKLKRLAKEGSVNNNHFWLQLNHPGRQCNRFVNSKPISSSEVKLKLLGIFGTPRAMTDLEISDVIKRFAMSAYWCKQAGFSGVQIHSAHGYLSNQFLSPLTNLRTDKWGGSLENRARLLLETVKSVRDAVGSEYPISVKLNSADFQKGGFSFEESIKVATWLDDEGIDLLEVSGGTYEHLVFMDNSSKALEERDSTKLREAYFLEYAKAIKSALKTPVMITGGFRTLSAMEEALNEGATDMIGIARPFCVEPDFPNGLLKRTCEKAPAPENGLMIGQGFWGPASSSRIIRAINNQGQAAWFYRQLKRLSKGEQLIGWNKSNRSVLFSFLIHMYNELRINLWRKMRKKS